VLQETRDNRAGAGNIKLIFDELQRDSVAGGGSRDEAMRLALQKKRWIEMQLHEVWYCDLMIFTQLHLCAPALHHCNMANA
jgi:hypothetical protein